MLHKIFHMNQSVQETQRRLGNVSGYRHHLDGVDRADFTGESTSQWKFSLPLGFTADFMLTEVAVDEASWAFRSAEGDLKVAGLISFHRVKSDLTEVDMLINYESSSKVFAVLDRVFGLGEQFIDSQLRRVTSYFAGMAAPQPRSSSFFPAGLDAVAT